MDAPLVYQLSCQRHSWVAMCGRDRNPHIFSREKALVSREPVDYNIFHLIRNRSISLPLIDMFSGFLNKFIWIMDLVMTMPKKLSYSKTQPLINGFD